MFDRVKQISTFVLLCCTHLLSLTSADTRSRRFIGLPETGQRVYYSNASENSRTVIVRHSLQVSDSHFKLIKTAILTLLRLCYAWATFSVTCNATALRDRGCRCNCAYNTPLPNLSHKEKLRCKLQEKLSCATAPLADAES